MIGQTTRVISFRTVKLLFFMQRLSVLVDGARVRITTFSLPTILPDTQLGHADSTSIGVSMVDEKADRGWFSSRQ